jgi:hypothetical protein
VSDRRDLLGAGQLAYVTPWKANYCEEYKNKGLQTAQRECLLRGDRQQHTQMV